MTATLHPEPRPLSLDRAVVYTALGIFTALSWLYLIHDVTSGPNNLPACCARPDPRLWGFTDLFTLFTMWTVMMIGMMAPTVAPMVLMFATVNRRRRLQGRPYVGSALFLLGYLLIWTFFSLVATFAQWGLHRTTMMSPEMVSANRWFGGATLIAAGIFQWTPSKSRCLKHCRSPLDFVMTEWREGNGGAIIMGFRHGIFCTGCCWLLMALLFVVGVMNLIWVAAITAFVLLEKLVRGVWFVRTAGVVLVGWGMWVMVGK